MDVPLKHKLTESYEEWKEMIGPALVALEKERERQAAKAAAE